MLLRIVAAITLSSALTGLLMILLGYRASGSIQFQPELIERRRKRRLQGSLVFWLSISAFVFLISRNFTPVEILFGLAICLAIAYPLTIIKGGLRVVSGHEATRPVAIAKDIATGVTLGTIVSKSKHGETTTYRMVTTNGQILEKSADSVKIELQ